MPSTIFNVVDRPGNQPAWLTDEELKALGIRQVPRKVSRTPRFELSHLKCLGCQNSNSRCLIPRPTRTNQGAIVFLRCLRCEDQHCGCTLCGKLSRRLWFYGIWSDGSTELRWMDFGKEDNRMFSESGHPRSIFTPRLPPINSGLQKYRDAQAEALSLRVTRSSKLKQSESERFDWPDLPTQKMLDDVELGKHQSVADGNEGIDGGNGGDEGDMSDEEVEEVEEVEQVEELEEVEAVEANREASEDEDDDGVEYPRRNTTDDGILDSEYQQEQTLSPSNDEHGVQNIQYSLDQIDIDIDIRSFTPVGSPPTERPQKYPSPIASSVNPSGRSQHTAPIPEISPTPPTPVIPSSALMNTSASSPADRTDVEASLAAHEHARKIYEAEFKRLH